jgi:hypothetical protein
MRSSLVALGCALGAAAFAVPVRAEELVTRAFAPVGAEQTWVVPPGVTSIKVVAVGGSACGHGAEVSGELGVTPGRTLYVEVGGAPSHSDAIENGGFNGGGAGGFEGGAGASDVRTAPREQGLSPDTRLLVAGGGGGCGWAYLNTNRNSVEETFAGGNAGEAGQNGNESAEGGGAGTATAGGRAGPEEECETVHGTEGQWKESTSGSLGLGGNGGECWTAGGWGSVGGGGGGGGLYGGGGGGANLAVLMFESDAAGGGGGSSLVPAGGSVTTAARPSTIEFTYVQPPNPPAVTTESASGILAEAATISGVVSPEHEEVTSCSFEYGATAEYGKTVGCSQIPSAGTAPVTVSANLSGLERGRTYHYRISASNRSGTSVGGDREFTTRPHAPIAISSFGPALGSPTGGTRVVFTGTELQYVTSVSFGGVAGTSLQVSPTEVAVTTPSGSESVGVVVESDLGERVSPGQFTYASPPSIKKLVPKKGAPTGGTEVTIEGANLAGATEVLFGTSPAMVVKDSSSLIVAIAPPGTTGKADVRVVTVGGTSAISSKDVFTYANPLVASVTPAHAPKAGGVSVTVTGNGFATGAGQTAFAFGKATASDVSCSSSSSCTMKAPASSKTGAVYVLANVGGKKSKQLPQARFTYE